MNEKKDLSAILDEIITSGDEIIKNNAEAAAPAAAFKGLIGPAHGLRFGGVKVTE